MRNVEAEVKQTTDNTSELGKRQEEYTYDGCVRSFYVAD